VAGPHEEDTPPHLSRSPGPRSPRTALPVGHDTAGRLRRALHVCRTRSDPPDPPAHRAPRVRVRGRRARLPPCLGTLAGGRGRRRPRRLGAGPGVRLRPVPVARIPPCVQTSRAQAGRADSAGASRHAGDVQPRRPALRRPRAQRLPGSRRNRGQHRGHQEPAAARANGHRTTRPRSGRRSRGAERAAEHPGDQVSIATLPSAGSTRAGSERRIRILTRSVCGLLAALVTAATLATVTAPAGHEPDRPGGRAVNSPPPRADAEQAPARRHEPAAQAGSARR
jgi:hypothetical protein